MPRISAPKPDDKWRAEMDLDTLMRASEIRKDPKRMAACKKIAAERMKALGNIHPAKEKAADGC